MFLPAKARHALQNFHLGARGRDGRLGVSAGQGACGVGEERVGCYGFVDGGYGWEVFVGDLDHGGGVAGGGLVGSYDDADDQRGGNRENTNIFKFINKYLLFKYLPSK